ncbi:hypothetical protein FGSG_09064 [Fusarium graminearum PH-1]|uniref:hypothetical protein n=1 Tax=Gibberella zeae (strain ATCC MYA-4620 / CBS 123657 / FGSC 9075 / NRRL 31084 / PH-1) TaxID=229533 RepID=UPI000023DFDF|nr:hypothetical protein FGSG_09064 [Fusarium graminearum PH-1]ESU15586.1 hypothetical protein FGSG_09064 [Fusarium graminearum PH-1]|eukprot:XP_011328730.1 hypothetical protein FGSG_09064 [Fusarium graminearum PH-1]
MPRPIVPAHQRQRAAEACNLCRETKKRCSGSAPCTQCVRRGLESQCFITYAPRGSRTRARAERAAATVNSVTSTGRTSSVSNQSVQQNLETEENYRPLSPSHSQQEDDRDSQADASSATNPRMLLNSRGERVYIGGAASISFLQIVRNLVSQQIGPSAFSHNEKSDTMLEIESPTATTHDHEINADLSLARKTQYLHSYYAVTEALIHIFDTPELEAHLLSPADSPSHLISPLKQASLDLVIAIGAQCESLSSSRTIGQAYFRKARSQAFIGFLEDPDLDMVRTFVLMAFYMLAAKAALALGLHSRESYGQKPDSADQAKLRVWMSVCILDKLVNSLLGRPSASAQIRSDSKLDDVGQPGDRITECLMAANKKVTIPIVEQFLQDIERWKRDLPASVKIPTEASGQHGTIAKVHVSCLYYLAVMLVSRPFLISTLTAKPLAKGAHSQLAAACLDAAMYLSQICVEALDAGLLQGNMCIMKALVFGAGLILGLEIFAKYPVESDINTAFQGAKQVLKHLSTQSPQAAHYLDILTTLSGAIDKRRSSESSTGRSRYVSKLFSLDAPTNSQDENMLDDMFPFTDVQAGVADDAMQDWVFQEPQSGDFSLDWESLNVSLWDTYPFLS